MAAMGDPEGYQLAYEAGLQAVESHVATLRETRDRAGSLMSVAAVAGGLTAGLAFTSDRTTAIDSIGVVGAALAVAGFAGVVVTAVLIWRPAEVRFAHDAGIIVGSYVEADPPLDLPAIHRELALWLGDQAETNRRVLAVRSVDHRRSAGTVG